MKGHLSSLPRRGRSDWEEVPMPVAVTAERRTGRRPVACAGLHRGKRAWAQPIIVFTFEPDKV